MTILHRSPNILSLYRRALFAKGNSSAKGSALPKLPTQRITLANIQAEADKVDKYNQVCGFNQDNNQLPITFPHIMAFPLHLELMLLKNFPFAVMGMVHIHNRITQHRAIKPYELMDLVCYFAAIRKTDKGYEIDIKTEVFITGDKVWESVSTNLVRKKTDIPAAEKNTDVIEPKLDHQEFWRLSTNLGRRYASVSGDSNPIHLFNMSAKLFGFKGHIAHGMWTKARVAAALYNTLDSEACTISVDFKLPIFLPATIQLNHDLTFDADSAANKRQINFEVKEEAGIKPHMKGFISALV